jgi:hypothetical protein
MRTISGLFVTCVVLAASTLAETAPDDRPEEAFVATGMVRTAESPDVEEFGTAADSVVTLTSGDFYFFAGTEGTFNLNNGARSCGAVGPGGFCGWTAGFQLPTGAQIRGVEISACDSDPIAEVRFNLLRVPKGTGTPTQIVPFTGTGGTPGCTTFVFTVPAPVTVENDLFAYYAVFNSTPGTNVAWGQYRVRYRLQVSPAPALATFPNDVPVGNPYFRFVEALAAAGVTGGCGPGSFCPDSPITRGQMAVFLASALGLHFPN